MKAKHVRNILGPFFLIITAMVGVYVLLFKGGPLLPIESADAVSSLEIIVPVFVGQLAIIVQNYGKMSDNKNIPVASWVIVMPPAIVILMLVSVIGYIVWSNNHSQPLDNVGETFRAVVTLAVSLLNATTIIVISKFLSNDRRQAEE
jgi:hypothetical protein